MLAEGVHSIADTGNQGLLFLGGRRARKPADRPAPVRASAGNGTSGASWSPSCCSPPAASSPSSRASRSSAIPTSWSRWRLGRRHAGSWPSSSRPSRCARPCGRAGRSRATSGWPDFIRHAKVPELPVVLLEDTGALLGLAFALAGVAAWPRSPATPASTPSAALAIGAAAGCIAFVLAVEMKSLLIGEAAAPTCRPPSAPPSRARPASTGSSTSAPSTSAPTTCWWWPRSPSTRPMALAETAGLIDRAEAAVRADVPEARLMFLEPDVDRRMPSRETGGRS